MKNCITILHKRACIFHIFPCKALNLYSTVAGWNVSDHSVALILWQLQNIKPFFSSKSFFLHKLAHVNFLWFYDIFFKNLDFGLSEYYCVKDPVNILPISRVFIPKRNFDVHCGNFVFCCYNFLLGPDRQSQR